MGIEDPGWSKLIIVIAFLAFMILVLYYVKSRGRGFLSKLNQNTFLSIEETIAISNTCRASIITADQSRFLIIHGKSHTSTAVKLPKNKKNMNDIEDQELKVFNNIQENTAGKG